MNMRSLEYAVAVGRTGSLQGAAQACYATPGTVSTQITRLEEYLGARLFHRRRYPAELTAAGESMLPKIEALVQGYQAVVDEARIQSRAALRK